MITKIVPSSHEEWLRLRTQGFGSSEVAVACGLSPNLSPRQFWQRKMLERNGGIVEVKNDAIDCGHWLEGGVAAMFEESSGRRIIKSSAEEYIMKNDVRPYVQVSPDREFYWNPEGKKNEANKAILECKTTNLDISEEKGHLIKVYDEKNGKDAFVPISWYCQVQYLMLGSGRSRAALAWIRLVSRQSGYAYIERDDEFIDMMLKDLDEMWEHIQQNTEPPITTEADADAAKVKDESVAMADGDMEEIINRLEEIAAESKALDEEDKMLKEKVKVFIGENSMLMNAAGERLATYKRNKPTIKFNTDSAKRLQIEHPDIYERYLVEVQGARVLRVKR